ncbi:MAG: AMP-binding protein [Anaerolineales bacterium]|nr:AMP-binding protein [Anaerolineales bacterium]
MYWLGRRPSIYQTLLRNTTFPKRQLKSLRKVQQAGGKLSNVLIEELIAAVPAAQVYVMYGQTEATARLSYLPPEFLKTKLGSVGRGIPGVELQVLGEAGGEVKPGEVGEIVARGANISPGYLMTRRQLRKNLKTEHYTRVICLRWMKMGSSTSWIAKPTLSNRMGTV